MLRTSAFVFLSLPIVKRDVSSAKSFTPDFISFDKSLMLMRKGSGHNIDPCGAPVKTCLHNED